MCTTGLKIKFMSFNAIWKDIDETQKKENCLITLYLVNKFFCNK